MLDSTDSTHSWTGMKTGLQDYFSYNHVFIYYFSFFSLPCTDILPKKIFARDYLKSLEQMQEEEEEADY